MKERIKEWYKKNFPKDNYLAQINGFKTFEDVFIDMGNYVSPEFGDSVIRERVFSHLADLMKTDYEYVYERWIMCKISDREYMIG